MELYKLRRNANSGFFIETISIVAIIYFELGIVKIFMQKIQSQHTSWLFLCLKIVIECNNLIY